jgi:antitoxin VapB
MIDRLKPMWGVTMKQTTRIFDDEDGQSVRIPDNFRFASKEVWIRRDEVTGDVILRPRPSWDQILAKLDAADIPADFLSPEERNQGLPRERPGLFEDWIEDPAEDTSVE